MSRVIAYHKNGIGNLIMYTPALQAMSRMYGKIDVCIPDKYDWQDSRRQPCVDIMEACPFVARVISEPAGNYEKWFYTEHTEYGRVFDIFKDHQKRLMTSPDWIRLGFHEIEYYMKHARAMGYEGETPKQYCPVKEFETGFDKKLKIGLCNGYFKVDMWDKKAYPHFSELSYYLRKWFECDIVKVGTAGELDGVDADHDFTGKLGILETAYVISKLDLFITTDTGNMHIADALGVPMIVLFGGTLPSKNKPLDKRAQVLTAGLPCQPCQGNSNFHKCKNYDCMKKLYIGDVMYTARRMLRGF